MQTELERRLARLEDAGARLAGGSKGIEKESLRITPAGEIARTPHPAGLGSALTHPYITTDFSEALPELRTPPLADTAAVLAFLDELHRAVYAGLGDELLWAASMPCRVRGDESIPIAQYGTSNVGRMKRVYRLGLAHRYGRAMQAIAGVHFNYSLPDAFWPLYRTAEGDTRPLPEFVADRYFALVRNFQRVGWLVCYLFGASPAIDRSFLGGCRDGLASLDAGTCFAPHATSLRMSDIGYTNKAQAGLAISYDSLSAYVETLCRATRTPYPEFERIGVVVDGEYRQLNAHVLQIENEFYSAIRPKQPIRPGEKPTLALARRGVRYVEVRSLDVNPYEPLGVSEPELRFLEALLIGCLLADSPVIAAAERDEIEHNQQAVTRRGREAGLRLRRGAGTIALADWALETLEAIRPVCARLDAEAGSGAYVRALESQIERVRRPETTVSARLLEEMRAEGRGFCAMGMRLSGEHAAAFRSRPLEEARRLHYEGLAAQSVSRQSELEAADRIGFEEYLARYFAQDLACPAATS
ncbi:glutamate--cysteine ligase [Sulfurifustis variabilis]|uniref:Glutamate--cysteine ligase n=1 Tax=Sulfurifustis variabilis TaxID=1675686 RepID=A0A1B4V252_9GAMM|nr:glutamate--cysteine ligase [Sulfurifustis variabilis]BAU47589.1 glutamate--cysteine ligase [Sulfurifustis variabilis]